MSPPEAEAREQGGEGPAEQIADEAAESALAVAAAREIIAAREKGEDIPDATLQRMMSALTKIYTVRFQEGCPTPPIADPRSMPPTAVMVTCANMLRALNIEVFELAIWQAFSSGQGSKQ
jgi:hypothetical protein